jgi:hypothetical protein
MTRKIRGAQAAVGGDSELSYEPHWGPSLSTGVSITALCTASYKKEDQRQEFDHVTTQ